MRQLFLIDELTAGCITAAGFLLLAEREMQAVWLSQRLSLLLYADLDYLTALAMMAVIACWSMRRRGSRACFAPAMWWRAGRRRACSVGLPFQQQRTAVAVPESGVDEFRRRSVRPLPLSVGIAESSLQVGEGLQH